MQNGRVGWQARVHGRWGGGGEGALPPLQIGKKKLSEEILTSFTYVLLMKLGGSTNTAYMQKMEGGGRTGACPWWEGVGVLPPLLESEKK